MPTLGAHSSKLDAVRALRTRDGRREQRAFAVEGATMLAEALAAGRKPQAIYVTSAGLATLEALRGISTERVFVIPPAAMRRLSDLESSPGILAVFADGLMPLEALLRPAEPVLLLAGLADPGNAGTLVRTAEIFGIRRVVFGSGGVEPHNSKVVRATMGAVFRTSIATAEPTDLVEAIRRHGFTIVCAARGGTSLAEFRFPAKPLIAIGSERHGVTSWLPRCDLTVSIPHQGVGESLNAAIAGGIVLYAFAQQLRAN
ncbi:MAG: RNA methyltransferase [Candidatus Eremiobacteraeota bacterium]|nr:RNA methyltransferase [Candidatus Eremiobacteraeota bacterium]